MSLPGARDRVVWTGGDATPERIGVVDWTLKVGAVVSVHPFWAALEQQVREAATRVGDETDEETHPSGEDLGESDTEVQLLLISLAELITFVALAAH